MRASLTVGLAGETYRGIGAEVDGDEAVRLCAAGFAVPIRETAKVESADIETADVEQAVRKARAKK